jgi:ribosomal protein S6
VLKKYEAVVILDDRKHSDGGEGFIAEFTQNVEGLGGSVGETEEMGRRQLAHPINRRNAGRYWDLTIELPPAGVAELKEKYRLDRTVLRLEVFIYDRPERTSLKEIVRAERAEAREDEEGTEGAPAAEEAPADDAAAEPEAAEEATDAEAAAEPEAAEEATDAEAADETPEAAEDETPEAEDETPEEEAEKPAE